jgi:hypothetical protein
VTGVAVLKVAAKSFAATSFAATTAPVKPMGEEGVL